MSRLSYAGLKPLARIHLLLTTSNVYDYDWLVASLKPLARIHLLLTNFDGGKNLELQAAQTSGEDSFTPDLRLLVVTGHGSLLAQTSGEDSFTPDHISGGSIHIGGIGAQTSGEDSFTPDQIAPLVWYTEEGGLKPLARIHLLLTKCLNCRKVPCSMGSNLWRGFIYS